MKKKILSFALVAFSLCALPSVAQTTTTDNPATEQTACKLNDKCKKKPCLFDGMNLTEAQKSQLKELGQKRSAERKEMKREERADRQRNDSIRMAQRKADRKGYLEEVKAIIGPDNYVVFLENFYLTGGDSKAPTFKKMGKKGKGMSELRKDGDRKSSHKRDGKKAGEARALGARNLNGGQINR